MRDHTDAFLLDTDDGLSPEDRDALRAALAATPALADDLKRWEAARGALRAGLDAAVPDRELLVLAALSGEPFAELPAAPDRLDADDRVRLDAALPALREAVAAHPGVADAIARTRADAQAFDAAWDDALAAAPIEAPASAAGPTARPPARPAQASDRAAAPRPRRMRFAVRAASLVAVVAFAAILTTVFLRDSGWDTVTADTSRTVRLADGSTAELAAGTVLQIPTEAGAREARLRQGQALFRIEHDPSAPFEVQTANADITVLGTVFGVDADAVQTEVVLVSGRVRLAPRERDDAAVELAPGQRSRVLAADAPSAPAPADLGAALAWAGFESDVSAQGEPLAAVAARLAERFEVAVTVDAALAAEPVSGTFPGADGAEAALSMLAQTLGAELSGDAEAGFRIAE